MLADLFLDTKKEEGAGNCHKAVLACTDLLLLPIIGFGTFLSSFFLLLQRLCSEVIF